jgi:hypothetical protein
MNSIGVSTMCVAPLRHGVLGLSAALPSPLLLKRALAIAGRVM